MRQHRIPHSRVPQSQAQSLALLGLGSLGLGSRGLASRAWRGAALSACLAAAFCAAACSGGGSSSSGSSAKLAITDISVLEGQEWKINRPLDITFNKDIDFSSVSFNTIQIADEQGNSATGSFIRPTAANGLPNLRVVRFQPACPTTEDFSDAGLAPFTTYRLNVLGTKVGGLTVRSTAGDGLALGALVAFHSPNSLDPLELFLDTVPGPPAVRVRGVGGVAPDELAATHLDLGGQAVYFAMDLIKQEGRLPVGFKVPLNHYSIPENQVSVVLHFNQPVVATSANISSDLLSLEYDNGIAWAVIQTEVEMIENCTETGAAVRLTPRGLLPQESQLRVVMRQGFADLTGDATASDRSNFAHMDSIAAGGENPVFPGVTNPEADGVLEPFILSGNDPGSLEDTAAAFEVPSAHWGAGQLQASFAFGGTGGPDGTFDWHLAPGIDFVLDTVSDTIVGGDGGVPETTQAVINGVVDIRNLFIPESSRLIVVGPNTCTILASGSVLVLGEISVRGSNSPGVTTTQTTDQPEPGAKGQAGGGDGGTGSFLTGQSTPRGGRGSGAFGTPNGGGEGGEASYAAANKNARRGAGGGGGRLGSDAFYDHDAKDNALVRCQALIGLDAEAGAMGGLEGLGAVSQSSRALGGLIGPEPFIEGDDTNNFFGVMLTAAGELVAGELDHTLAGAGGGAGGDAVDSATFPLIPFLKDGDEKGAGGGGGAGGLKILAIGPIQIGDTNSTGSLAAEGGDGGGGESPGFFDRVGGGSGGGSGGHIVLSSAAQIVIWGKAASADDWYTDDPGGATAPLHDPRPISAVGGGGGAGNGNFGGANESGPVPWYCDRIPAENFLPFDKGVPPMDNDCWTAQPDLLDLEGGPTIGAGGDGSPGIIQFHVEDPATNLRFPTLEADQGTTYGNGLDVTYTCAPPPLGWHRPSDPVDSMIPFFGRLSRSQSKWIALGLARINPAGGTDQVVLRFEGTVGGLVPHDGSTVDQLLPIVGPDTLGFPGVPPYIGADDRTLVFDASGLLGQDLLLKANSRLILEYSVQLEKSGDPTTAQRFTITAAEYDAGLDRLVTHVDPAGPGLSSFVVGGSIDASLVPHFLRVVNNGILDSYAADTSISLVFDATKIDPLTGGPDEANSHGFTEDISLLNIDDWDFFRFQVEFDLDTDTNGVDLSTDRPGLGMLRLTFGF